MGSKFSIHKLFNLFTPKQLPVNDRAYFDDKRFIYNLIIVQACLTYSRVFGTSAPLVQGQRIVLSPNQSFVVMHIAHVIYRPEDDPFLTRPTTLLHASIAPSSGTKSDSENLQEIGFVALAHKLHYTIH